MIPGIVASQIRRGDPVPAVGEPWQGGFYAGRMEYQDGSSAYLILADKADWASSLIWKTTNTETVGSDSMDDGMSNTDMIVLAGLADHPAAEYCVNYAGGGFTDWYLAARAEFEFISGQLRGLDRWRSGGEQAFGGVDFASSTQRDTNKGQYWQVTMSSGSAAFRYKTVANEVAPVRRIPI